MRKLVIFCIWITFVIYTIKVAPLDRPDTAEIVSKLLTLRWGELNAYIPALFSLMGVWPIIYACLMFVDGKMQKKVRAWPSFIGSNGTGIICLTPYLLLRERQQEFVGVKDKWLEMLDRRKTGLALLLSTIGCIAYAVIFGSWQEYVHQFQNVAFVHLISIDFCLMCVLFPLTELFDDDMAKRGIKDRRIYWAVALIPLFGPLVYLCLRPPLAETTKLSLERTGYPNISLPLVE
ncbi:DUF2834 domain-containing protein [Ancylothrix sp. C2]|uniref:DUF2834 domain-containing protein n=1 Tax=Ancylothrix sp. D3o TaxID=2953691 RepID=UPI0021BAA84A|nr:DUF2834 domain-containing protein [Ancylothrix sp. D3o]MCT7950440.1 DUF2834 domain-containing protein [Ancylothrix sp. D3o]